MHLLGALLILLACLAFALAFLGPGGGTEDGAVRLALLAATLMVSGATFSSAAALSRRLDSAGAQWLAGAGETQAAPPVAATPPGETARSDQPAGPPVRRPGFHRTAA